MRIHFSVLVAALMALVTGCNQGKDRWAAKRPQTVPVSGIVMYKGEPVEKAQINFVPASATDSAAYAISKADGKFTLSTFETGDGAPPGSYQVTVNKKSVETIPNPNDPSGPPQGSKEVSYLPQKYGSLSTTTIEITVPESGTKDVVIELND